MQVITAEAAQASRSSPRGIPDTFDFSNWKDLSLPAPRAAAVSGPPKCVHCAERLTALLGLIALSPLMAAVALAIKIDSPGGPVFYRQERVGLNRRNGNGGSLDGKEGSPSGNGGSPKGNGGSPQGNGRPERRACPSYGKPFFLFKFRTMIPDAEKLTGPVWAQAHDPRITRVGRVLRRCRLDEIPQLFNVVRGEMRLIGPRPERPHFVAQLCEAIPQYAERLCVPPGITGLAQVEREYDASVHHVKRKVMYDLHYVRHWSRLMDAKIMITTIDVVLRGRGAR